MANDADTSGSGPLHLRNASFARSVSALFENAAHAETARQDLIAAGIRGDAIQVIGETAAMPGSGSAPLTSGFWDSIRALFMPEEDRDQFAEGVRRGGVTLSVRTDTANHDQVVATLDRDGAVDLDERQLSWRNDGWTGYTARDALAAGAPADDPLIDARTPALSLGTDDADMSYAPPTAGTAGFGASVADHFPVGIDVAPPVESPGALPVSTLDVVTEPPSMAGAGRQGGSVRDLDNGRPRVRSYVWSSDKSPKPSDEI